MSTPISANAAASAAGAAHQGVVHNAARRFRALDPAPSEVAVPVPKEDRVSISNVGRQRANAYEVLQNTSRVVRNADAPVAVDERANTVRDIQRLQSAAVSGDRSGQIASRISVVA